MKLRKTSGSYSLLDLHISAKLGTLNCIEGKRNFSRHQNNFKEEKETSCEGSLEKLTRNFS